MSSFYSFIFNCSLCLAAQKPLLSVLCPRSWGCRDPTLTKFSKSHIHNLLPLHMWGLSLSSAPSS